MKQMSGFQTTLPDLLPKQTFDELSRESRSSGWQPPTFAEFIRRIEHEFGDSVDLSSLPLTRADGDQTLTPGSIRSLCEVLGVPPEDLGV